MISCASSDAKGCKVVASGITSSVLSAAAAAVDLSRVSRTKTSKFC